MWLLLAALSAGCVGSETPTLSTTTVTPPPSLAVDPCPLNVPAESVNAVVPAAGESRTLDVITGATCNWTAESRAPFIAITPTSGQGSGTVTLTVQANTGAPRSGSVIVNRLTLTVSQAAAPCTFALTSNSQGFGANGGSGTVGVTVVQGVDCQWTSASNASFIGVTSGSSGTGSGTVAFQVAPNSGAAPRSGTLTIAGMTFTVNQAGLTSPPPDIDVRGLQIAGFVRPWCASSFAIQADQGGNFPSPAAPGSFQHPSRSVIAGSVVELRGTGAGSVSEWTGCDSTSGGVCRVTMTSNRGVQAQVAETCASPSFSSVSRSSTSVDWVVQFTAVNLLPWAGSSFGGVTFTLSCDDGPSSTLTVPSQASGTISGSISISMGSCLPGTLSLTDFNGTATTSW